MEFKPPPYLPLIIAGTFGFFLVAERFFPLRGRKAALVGRVALNLAISGLAFLVALVAVRPSALGTVAWSSRSSFGLLQVLAAPGWVKIILGVLLLDLTFYYWHWLNHKIPVLWRFHNVHHLDPDLDVSTGFRFHFGEVLFSTVFRVVQVSLLGVSLTTFVVYELIFQAGTLFHHSNVRLPIGLERLLNLVFVTPRMHGIHHSQVRLETNSNYGVVFCWWDKVHRTIGLNIPQKEIVIGIPGYSAPQDNTFMTTLAAPFRKQRDYWRRADGSIPEREKGQGSLERLAE